MVSTKLEIKEEEKNILLELSLKNPIAIKARKSIRMFLVIFIILLIILGIINKSLYDFFIVILAILFIIFAPNIQKIGFKKQLKSIDKRMFELERIYNISNDGIEIKMESSIGMSSWDMFIDYGEMSHYIWIKRMDTQVVLIDINKITDDEKKEIEGYLKKINKK